MSKITFKLIKSATWETSTGKKGTTLVVARAGRAFVINPEDFDEKVITVNTKNGTVTTNYDKSFDIVKDTYVNELGVSKTGFKLKPKLDFGDIVEG